MSEYPTNQITQMPGGTDAGALFNYQVWTPGSRITMTNVPWDSGYRDIVQFTSRANLDAYIDDGATAHVTLDRMTYLPAGMPIRVNIPFNSVWRYNYLRVVNGYQPVTAHTNSGSHYDSLFAYYYFITDAKYIAPNTTEIVVQLDVWQTFGQRVVFGNCYVERGHAGIANTNNFADYGRSYLTIPEGLDMGNEYVYHGTSVKPITQAVDSDPGDQWVKTQDFDIVVTSTVSLIGDAGSTVNGYDPIDPAMAYGTESKPILVTATGSTAEGLPNGAETYLITSQNVGGTMVTAVNVLKQLMLMLSAYPWISQGIVSITAVPPTGINIMQENVTGQRIPFKAPGGNIFLWRMMAEDTFNEKSFSQANWRNMFYLPPRYSHLKKFLTYPYSLLEATLYNGAPLIIKPECIPTKDIVFNMAIHAVPPSPRVVIYPAGYNAQASQYKWNSGEWLDFATGITNLPTFSVVNNSYLAYMASNAHSIAYQYSSSDWSQQRAMMGADASKGISEAQSTLNRSVLENNVKGLNRQREIANASATMDMSRSAVGAAMHAVTNPLGAVAGFTQSAMGSGQSILVGNATTENQVGQMRANDTLHAGQEALVRDTNYNLASNVAKGDYSNAIAGINAKVQDAKMIQPTTSGQVGGEAFMLAKYGWQLHLKAKMISPASVAAIGEYWLRYGYAVNRFLPIPGDLNLMQKFTYWKMRETYISVSQCPELFKNTIRGIFEKGVTVWRDPGYIGTTDIGDNLPSGGYSF